MASVLHNESTQTRNMASVINWIHFKRNGASVYYWKHFDQQSCVISKPNALIITTSISDRLKCIRTGPAIDFHPRGACLYKDPSRNLSRF